MTLDAAGMRELAALRRRAYGPDADIHDDPDALARLVELERLARPSADAGAVAGPAGGPVGTADAPPIDSARGRRLRLALAVVAVIAVALGIAAGVRALTPAIVGAEPAQTQIPSPDAAASLPPRPPSQPAPPEAREAYAYANASRATILALVPVPVPADPAPAAPRSATGSPVYEQVGRFFGVEVFVASSTADDRACLLLDTGRGHQRCVSQRLFQEGALMLTLSFAEIPAAERPPEMSPQQSLAFWWTAAGDLTMVTGLGDVGQ